MTVSFDSTFLLYLFRDPGTVGTPMDSNGQPIQMAKERVEGLLAELQRTNTQIIVGTPALSEIMVRAGVEAGQRYIALMAKAGVFKIVPFDVKSAIEAALMHGHALDGERGKSATEGTYAKVKYDRQIVAIAKTEGVLTLYTDDGNQRSFAEKHGMTVRGLADCPVPSVEVDLFAYLEGGTGEDES